MPAIIPSERIDRAIALLEGGVSAEEAAAAIDCTSRTLRAHLRRRGLHPSDLRPVVTDYKGRIAYHRLNSPRRSPCRYCGAPAAGRNAACGKAACRARWWDELPEEERERRLRARGSRDDRRREAGQIAYNDPTGGRHDLHIFVPEAAMAALRLEAARRQCSLSRLVLEALRESGLIPEADG